MLDVSLQSFRILSVLAFAGLLLALGIPYDAFVQSQGTPKHNVNQNTGRVDPAVLDGNWEELSFEVGGKPSVEWELDTNSNTFVPVYVAWRLSSKFQPEFTRRVLRGDTENNAGDLYFGKHVLNTSIEPHQITFTNENFGIEGIFKTRGDLLVIAIPRCEYDSEAKSYCVAKRPSSFDTKHDVSGITVYTLRRKTSK